MAVNFPADRRIFGGNIVPRAADIAVGNEWAHLILDWPWEDWLKPQIDHGISAGVNCIRYIGYSLLCTIDDTGNPFHISEDEYFTKHAQIAAYCRSRGVYFYPADSYHAIPDFPSYADWAGIYNRMVAELEPYWDIIIGIDVSQECNLAGGLAQATTLLNLLDFGTAPFGATASVSMELARLPGTSGWSALVAAADYIDVHDYGAQNTAEQYNTLMIANPMKEIVIGESGISKSASIAARTAWYVAAGALFRHKNPLMRGGLMWGLTDQGTGASSNYGMFNTSWVADAAIVNGFIQGSSTSAAPAAPTNVHFHEGAIYASPLGASTSFASMNVYRNGALLAAGLPTGRYDDSAEWSLRWSYYQFTAVNRAGVESAKSAAVAVPRSWSGETSARTT